MTRKPSRRRDSRPPELAPRLYTDLAELWPLVSPPEDYPEEVASFRARFQRHGVADGAAVLHLGSGGGSVDFHLKRHYRLTGLDRSPAMLAQSRLLNPEVEYLEGDLRTARLGRRFDAVLLHDAIAYLVTPAELRAGFATAAAHLGPGGVLVTTPEELTSHFQQHRVQGATYSRGDRSVTTVEVSFDPDPADTWFEQTLIFVIRQAGQPPRFEVDTHRCGLYSLDEVLDALRETGFEPRAEAWEIFADLPAEVPYPLVTAVKRGPG